VRRNYGWENLSANTIRHHSTPVGTVTAEISRLRSAGNCPTRNPTGAGGANPFRAKVAPAGVQRLSRRTISPTGNYPLLQSQPTVDNSVFNTDMKRHRASKVNISTACVFALALFTFTPMPLLGQGCPQASETGPHSPSEVRTLEGRLVFHDAIREWFELKLDALQCGQAAIELVRVSLDDRRPLEFSEVAVSGRAVPSASLVPDTTRLR
jgi:hypothetical protein